MTVKFFKYALFTIWTFGVMSMSACATDDDGEDTDPGGTDNNPGGTDNNPGGTDNNPGGTDNNPGGTDNNPGGTDNEPSNVLTGLIRDFKEAHPDFEYVIESEKGIVTDDLGADGKPVYAGGPQGTETTTGPENFNQWYNDVDGVNMSTEHTITLTPGANGVASYETDAFFPIDDQLWGNEGNRHNYHFTFEIHTRFTYEGGEVFSFSGDDDVWVYINKRLAIDLGGVHGVETDSVNLDESAAHLGITPGNEYTLDFFFAERHTSESNFLIETTIGDLVSIPPVL